MKTRGTRLLAFVIAVAMAVLPVMPALGAESESFETETVVETATKSNTLYKTVETELEVETEEIQIGQEEPDYDLQKIAETVGVTEVSTDDAMVIAKAAELTDETIETGDDIETGSCGDNVTYVLNNATGVLTISGTGDIDACSFSNNKSLKDVVIQDGITSIGEECFSECANLVVITVPDSVISIGQNGFFKLY